MIHKLPYLIYQYVFGRRMNIGSGITETSRALDFLVWVICKFMNNIGKVYIHVIINSTYLEPITMCERNVPLVPQFAFSV